MDNETGDTYLYKMDNPLIGHENKTLENDRIDSGCNASWLTRQVEPMNASYQNLNQ